MPGGRRHPPHQGLPRARLTRCGSRAAMVARDGDHRRSRGIDRNDHWLCVEHYLRHRSARRISTCGTIAAKKASLVATWWPRGSRSSVPLGHTDAGHGAHKWKRARLGCRTVHQATLHEHLEEEGWHVAAISRPVRPPLHPSHSDGKTASQQARARQGLQMVKPVVRRTWSTRRMWPSELWAMEQRLLSLASRTPSRQPRKRASPRHGLD